MGYRFAHHGEKLSTDGARVEVHEVPATPDPTAVVNIGDLAIEAFEVDHFPVVPALGFRFATAGKKLVISGDTTMCPSLARASAGVDVLVCEAMNHDLMRRQIELVKSRGNATGAGLLEDAMTYHGGTDDVATLARDARVKRLVLSHLIPPIPDEGTLVDQFVAGMKNIYQGELVVGRDLQRFEV
jgi:ribonuclease Z